MERVGAARARARRLGPVLLAIAAGLACGSPALAQTYDVKVDTELNGLDVKVEPVPMSGLLIVKLTNQSTQKVRCDLRYDAAPQPLYRKTTYVDPGKTEQSEFRAKRKWFEVEVKVECRPADQ
ncbi:MAG TPA: hypothetical protein VF851_10255 [Steroidobacteraceae bacterium]